MANEFKIKKGLIVTGASGGTVVDIQGSQGQLFSVTDDLSGSIFAVSDISGVPIFTVNSSGLSTFDGNIIVGDSHFIGNDSFDNLLLQSSSGENLNLSSSNDIIFYTGGTTPDALGTQRLRIFNSNGSATFTGKVRANDWFQGADSTNTLYSATSLGTLLQAPANSGTGGSIYLRNNSGTVFQEFSQVSGGISSFNNGKVTSLATAASDGGTTLTTKSYVDGLVTGVPVYKGTWDARNNTERGSGSDGGDPDLRLTVNKILGNYYIVETAGSATPNGANTEPSSWNVGDWCIFSDITSGAGTDLWQKIDNTSVISGAGTGQKVTKWEGATNAVSETLTDGPITFSTSNNDSTFAGDVTIGNSNSSATTLNLVKSTSGVSEIKFLNATNEKASIQLDAAEDLQIFSNTSQQIKLRSGGADTLTLDASQNATFAGGLISANSGGYFRIQNAAGNSTYPTYSFQDDGNTGMMSSSTDSLSFVTGGTTRLLLNNVNATFAGDVITSLRLKSTGADTQTNTIASSALGIALQNTSNTDGNFIPIDFFNSTGFVTARIGAEFQDAGDRNTDLYFCTRANSGSLTQRMSISSIGAIKFNNYNSTNNTGTPTYLLGTDASGNIVKTNTVPGSGAGPYLPLSAGSSYPLTGDLYLDGSNQIHFVAQAGESNTEDMRITRSSDKMYFTYGTNAGDEAFYFDSSGNVIFEENVGIGTTSPGAKLHVAYSNSSVYSTTSPSGDLVVSRHNTSNVDNQTVGIRFDTTGFAGTTTGQAAIQAIQTSNLSSADLAFLTRNNATFGERMRITSAGELQVTGNGVIKNEHSSANFSYWQQTASDARLFTQYAQPLYFGTNASTKMTILSGGNVGINTTGPTAKLHVLGTSTGNATTKAEMLSNSVFSVRPHATNSGTLAIAQVDSGNSVGMQFTNGPGTSNWDISLQPFGGNVGIGTTSPGNLLDVAGDTDITGQLVVSHDANYVAKLVNTATSMSNNNYALMVDSSAHTSNMSTAGAMSVDVNSGRAFTITGAGNVGIGEDTPENILHIKTAAAGGPQIQLESTSGTAAAAFINFDSTNLQLSTQRDMVDGTWYDTAKSWGGINIQGPAGGSFITFQTAAASNTSPTERLRIASDGKIQVGSDKVIWAGGYGGALVIRQNNATGDRLIKMVTVDSTGAIANDNVLVAKGANVGIGTASPSAKLDIALTTGPQLRLTRNAGTEYSTLYSDSAGGLIISSYSSGTSNYQVFSINSSEKVRIINNGNVGIGTTSPQTELHIKGNNGWGEVRIEGQTFASGHGASLEFYSGGTTLADIYANTSKDLILRTNGTTERMRITSAGNVGIGTSTPNAKLDIQGTQGQLFSVTDDLSGSIFAVADISGVPILDVNSSGVIIFGSYNGSNQTGTPTYILGTDASGNVVKTLSGGGTGGGFWQSSGNNIYNNNSGNVGVGTAYPDKQFSQEIIYYDTGTASQSGTTITGVGTTFTSAMDGKKFIFADGTTTYITAFTNTTTLTATTSATVASQSFSIYTPGVYMGRQGVTGNPPQLSIGGSGSGYHNLVIKGDVSNGANSIPSLQIARTQPGVVPTQHEGLILSSSGTSHVFQTSDTKQLAFSVYDTSAGSSAIAMYISGITNPTTVIQNLSFGEVVSAEANFSGKVNIYDSSQNNESKLNIQTASGAIGSIGFETGAEVTGIISSNTDVMDFRIGDGVGISSHRSVRLALDYLEVFNSSDNSKIRLNANGDSYLNGGEVGINETSPSATLHLQALASNGVPFKLVGDPATSTVQQLIRTTQNYTSSTAWYNIVCEAANASNTIVSTFIVERDGDVRNINNSYGQISDSRLKENIQDATPKLDDIMKVKVKNFNFIGDELKQIGVVAQELEEVFPGLVKENEQPGPDGTKGGVYKSVKYSVLVPILLKAMQEQQDQIEDLKTRITQLEN